MEQQLEISLLKTKFLGGITVSKPVPLVLVVCKNANFRKLYVDNLVIRGHVAVGVASAAEAKKLVEKVTPSLIIVCCTSRLVESDLRDFRLEYNLTVPILLVSMDRPDKEWMVRWNIARSLNCSVDVQTLVESVQRFLP